MKLFKKKDINPLYLKRKCRVKVENVNRKNHTFVMKKVVKIGDLGGVK